MAGTRAVATRSSTAATRGPSPQDGAIALGYPRRRYSQPFWRLQHPWVDSVLGSMSIEEKIGQLFMVAAYTNRGPEHEAELRRLVTEQKVGGLIWFQGGPVRQVNWTNRLQLLAEVPLLIGQDAEWGPSMRLDSTVRYPRHLGMGAIAEDRVVYRYGREVARQLHLLGVHINFAPVVDVNNNPNNPVINDRSFGEDRLNVSLKGLAYMEGMQEHGVLACGKHFPGHGDTDVDSHVGLPVIEHPWQRLDTLELYPFKVLMSQGLASVMTAHLHIPTLDDAQNRAASVSPAITGALLRDSLGYQGLAITDALNMKGVAAHYAPGALEVEAFRAGNDILLFPEDVPAAAKALKAAFASGELQAAELERRVRRILQAKAWVGLDQWQPHPTQGLTEALNAEPAQRWLDGLWVPHCVACAEPEVHGLCPRCVRDWGARPLDVAIDGVRHAVALAPYDSATGDRLRRAKYGGDRGAIVGLSHLFAQRVEPWIRGAADAVVPVPSPWPRRARRGFSAAAVLGRTLARRAGLPLVHALTLRPGAPNAAQGRRGRRANLRERLRARVSVPGHVVLVDDVATTGATSEACARELLGGAAQSVVVAVLCATERREDSVVGDTH